MRKTCISKGWYLTAPGTDGFVQVDLPNDYTIGLPRSASSRYSARPSGSVCP